MTTAQDEFNALVSEKNAPRHHPADSSSSDDDRSTTLAPSTTSPNKSTHTSIRGARARTRRDSEDEFDDTDDDAAYPTRPRKSSSTYYLPYKYDANANTGPKGVIADAGALEELKRGGGKDTYSRTRELVLPKAQKLSATRSRSRRRKAALEADGLSEDEEDAEEAEYLQQWREKRLNELRSVQAPGPLEVVDAEGYLDAVDGAPKGRVVCVYIFDEQLPASQEYHACLAALAAKYSNVHFIAMHYKEAEMEHAGVPALLAYRGGDKFAGLVPLTEDIPLGEGALSHMEEAFARHGIL